MTHGLPNHERLGSREILNFLLALRRDADLDVRISPFHMKQKHSAYAQTIAAKFTPAHKRPTITKNTLTSPLSLPDEIVYGIFANLSTADLASCSETCQQWRDILLSYHTLWCDFVELKGTLQQIQRQWDSIVVKQGKGVSICVRRLIVRHWEPEAERKTNFSAQSANVFSANEYDRSSSQVTPFYKTFPFKTLKYVNYQGHNEQYDSQFWLALSDCEQLRSLKFDSNDENSGAHYLDRQIESDAPITRCKLRRLRVHSHNHYEIKHFRFNRMRALLIDTVLEGGDVLDSVVDAARRLEVLQVSAIFKNEDEEDMDEKGFVKLGVWRPIDLPRLKTFRAIYNSGSLSSEDEDNNRRDATSKVIFELRAPRLAELTYSGFLGWDATLFHSCKHSLQVAYLELNDGNSAPICKALKQFCSLRMLTLRMSSSKTSHVRPSSCSVWLHYRTDFHRSKLYLSRLESLTIIGDDYLVGSDMVFFAASKKAEGSRYIKSDKTLMRLHLQDCPMVDPEATRELGQIVPVFTCTLTPSTGKRVGDSAGLCSQYTSVHA